jgi:hypothetical protein
MDTREAQALLVDKLSEYRRLPYATLRAQIGAVETSTIVGPSGVEYQIEVQVVWDNKPRGTVRVLGSIDNGGVRAIFPLCLSFSAAPDGEWIGEIGSATEEES